MTIYIALLRGINVGGKHKIKMADLKRIFETMGLSRVQTYIQSGNVLFVSDEEEEPLRKRLEQEIEVEYGFPVPVILRTSDELKRVTANCPFSEETISEAEASNEGESLYVSFMLEEPSQEKVERLEAYRSKDEHYRIVGKEVFLLFHRSVRDSKLANNLHKLDVPSTVRNWKTTNKLVELASAMEVNV
ncbi:DUF1697 domain-containing protein [Paenibacillus sp. GCM10027628]|uniref:DUF1697 domain-containing protein n=1 Tax=Paenibacillus sp. GCM10027628 TaxID=3273413 RepID=UPI00362D292C